MGFVFDKSKKLLHTETVYLAQGDVESTTLELPLEIDENDEYNCFLEFELPKNRKFVGELTRNATNFTYVVPDFVAYYVGSADMQLVLYKKDDNEVYKTMRVIGKLVVKKSINAIESAEQNLQEKQYDELVSMINDRVKASDCNNALADKASKTEAAAYVSTHNTNTVAHGDIRSAVGATEAKATAAQSTANAAVAAAESAQSDADTAQADVDALNSLALKHSAQTLTTTQKQQARSNIAACTLLDVYPIGALYLSTVETSPQVLFGGTWLQITADAYLKIVTEGGGELGGTLGGANLDEPHKIPLSSMPLHTHGVAVNVNGSTTTYGLSRSTTASSSTVEGAGGGEKYYPYYVGVFVWKRTA